MWNMRFSIEGNKDQGSWIVYLKFQNFSRNSLRMNHDEYFELNRNNDKVVNPYESSRLFSSLDIPR